MFVLVMATCTS